MLLAKETLFRRSLLSCCLVIALIIVFGSVLEPMVDQTIDNQIVFNIININMLLAAIFGHYIDKFIVIQIAFFTCLATFTWAMVCLTLVLFHEFPNVFIVFFYFGFHVITIELFIIIVV